MDPKRVYPVECDAYMHRPPYEMLPEDGMASTALQPQPNSSSVPLHPARTRRSCLSCCCLFGFCSCCCIIFLCMITAFFFAVFIAYAPKVPSYTVQNLQVTAFDIRPDFTLHAEFLLAVQAYNPNKGISIIYGNGGYVSVVYEGSELCSGNLPTFRQEQKNRTVMEVELKGDSPFGSGLQGALMYNRESKEIPLIVFVQVPVKVVLEWSGAELGPMVVRVVCHLVVDNLSPKEKIKILETHYDVDLENIRLT